ncbi:sarcosine oxidase subunit alpha family protein [Microbaculum marinum]|uniref:Sarcosine oxidase subunit alpha family protein n=1 Tax=Microbaculum marinum TaxID=1764581 RepID=A0AAW9RWF5_9HYPH
MSGYRLGSGGALVDRDVPLSFTFDGKSLRGYSGDTVASALLASGIRVVGRSFKYHRPRGIFSCGPEEPNALLTIGEGGRAEPNARATTAELHDRLVAVSQNRWPSLDFDVMAVNGMLSPVFTAGFYYKTFMGPTRGAWHVYEHFIRRAAGMGAASGKPDPDRYEKSHMFCDVLVVGAGAAGLSAALAAARSGARVVLMDENAHPGGWLQATTGRINGLPALEWARATVAALRAFPNAVVMSRTTVYGYYDQNQLGAVERVTDHLSEKPAHLPRHRHWTIRATEVVLATGAIEQPVLVDGNDVPGVMLAGAVSRYAVGYGVAAGRRPVFFGGNDGVWEAALACADAGIAVAAVVDPRAQPPHDLAAACEAAGITARAGSAVVRIAGSKAVSAVEIAKVDAGGRITGQTETLAADICATSAGWMPAVHLHSQAGSRPVFDDERGIFLPGEPRERWRSAGACQGIFGLAACLADGESAGLAAAEAAGFTGEKAQVPATDDSREPAQPLHLRAVDSPRGDKAKIFIDQQHDVTAGDVILAHREGFRSVEHLKRYTTLGMATDQGKTSNVAGLSMMAALRGDSIAAVGTTTFRAPYTPVALGALGGREAGRHIRPLRRTPMHDWHVGNRAEMMPAGAWERPRVYYLPGETLEQAYVREARMVRQSVGIVDVSTLGKIDVQGPDAAAFLDRVYTNMFSTLAVGKARYGLMLRDDGMLFDDGTSWRLSETRYLMTTTTANAGPVMQWLEFLLATEWPDLKVHLTSVTDVWAGMALAGPNSRKVLERVAEGIDVSGEGLPHLGVREGVIAGRPGMVARLSFSGELAYEVYVPARFGLETWEALLEAGREFDIIPYGLEALGTLRIEKGHVAGAELDGRTTAADLGLGGLLSKKKDFIGKQMVSREGLVDASRLKLVGLVSREEQGIRIGSQIVRSSSRESPGPSIGHVTSNAYSPALGKYIALALVERGSEMHGQAVYAADPVRGRHVSVDVRDAHFFDPDGSRMHV